MKTVILASAIAVLATAAIADPGHPEDLVHWSEEAALKKAAYKAAVNAEARSKCPAMNAAQTYIDAKDRYSRAGERVARAIERKVAGGTHVGLVIARREKRLTKHEYRVARAVFKICG